MFEEWLKQFPIKKYEKNDRLFHQGDRLQFCYHLLDGICAQEIVNENGTEIVTKYFFPKDLLNIWGIIKEHKEYTSTAVARSEASAVVIPVSEILRKLNTDFAFYRWAVESMLHNNMYVFQQYQKKAKGSAAEILCYSLLSLSRDVAGCGLCLSKIFTYNELSQHLRIHRITISHIFKVLEDDKIIKKCKHGWQITDLELLKQYANGNITLIYND